MPQGGDEPKGPGGRANLVLRAARWRFPPVGSWPRRTRHGIKLAVRASVPPCARASFRVDITGMLLAGLYTGAVFPFITVIARDDLRAGKQLLALISAAPFLGNLLALFWARAMEGRKKAPFVAWSWGIARVIVLLTLIARDAWAFALVMAAAQIVGSISTPAYAAIMKNAYPSEQRGRILSMTRAAIIGAQVVSTFVSGWLLSVEMLDGVSSYRIIFPLAALVGITGAVIYSRILPGEVVEPTDEGDSGFMGSIRTTGSFVMGTLGILRTDLAYRWFALSVFTYGFGNLLTLPIVPLIQVDELHIAKWQVSSFTIAQQLVMVLAFFYWGRYVDERSPQRAVVVNILLNALIPICYILAGTVLPATAWSILPAYVIGGIVGAGIDLSYFAALLTFAGDRDISRYQALQSFLLGVRGSLAPFVGGALADGLERSGLNLRVAFGLALLFIFAGCWMQLVAIRRQEAVRNAGVDHE